MDTQATETYFAQADPATVPTQRAVLELLGEELTDATLELRHGIAMLCWSDIDLVGISAAKGFYSLYVPHGATVEKFATKLGRVSVGKGSIHFKRFEDVDEEGLRAMAAEIRHLFAADMPTQPIPHVPHASPEMWIPPSEEKESLAVLPAIAAPA